MENILLYFSMKYSGNFDLIYKALETKEKVDPELEKELLTHLKSHYVTILSPNYPERLKYINCPPFVLYYYGNLDIINTDTIGVIGMRQPSEYGIYATTKIVKELIELDYTIVSGMALGVDGVAHRTACLNNGKTIAILGSGIDYCYPKSNIDIYKIMKADHLIMSEYPFDITPIKGNFPQRNRIIAGLSDKIVVSEAKEKSGTMITVGYALENGKDVCCIPSRIYDSIGCNKLIQQGAKLVNSVKDIIEES